MSALRTAALPSRGIGLPPEVRGVLGRAARVLRYEAALVWLTRGVLAAAATSLSWTLLGTIIPVGVAPILVLVGGGALAVLLGFGRALLPARDLRPAARRADAELRLHERLSTTLDLAAGRITPTALAGLLLADTAHAARGVAPRSALRPRAPGAGRWAMIAVAAAVTAALVVPGITIPSTPAHDTAERVRREGRRLQEFARQLEQRARAERAPQARRAAPQVRALGQQLQQQRQARSDALARISALERQLEQVRRQVAQRIAESLSPDAPSSPPESLFRPSTTLDQSIRNLRELAARLSQGQRIEGEQQDLLEQLAGLAQAGEGQLPVEARRKLDEARQQIERGDLGGGREALSSALDELEALRAMMADESALRAVERELDRSARRIGQGGTPSEEAGESGETDPSRPAPGERRVREQEGDTLAPPPPEGTNEGTQPGEGRIGEKLGASTPRLQAPEQRIRVQGREGQRQMRTTELLGPGRRTPSRLPEGTVGPAVVRRADEHLTRLRIPADLRRVVRRYFELLAGR